MWITEDKPHLLLRVSLAFLIVLLDSIISNLEIAVFIFAS